jgi:hypothetical protein
VYRAIPRGAGKSAELRRALEEAADPRDLARLLEDAEVFGTALLDDHARRIPPGSGVVRGGEG